jgi:hypothetical protein
VVPAFAKTPQEVTGVPAVAEPTTTVKPRLAVCGVAVESFTCTVKDELPVAVGAPEIFPLAAPKLSPAGKAPELIDQVYGAVPPVANTVAENGDPT